VSDDEADDERNADDDDCSTDSEAHEYDCDRHTRHIATPHPACLRVQRNEAVHDKVFAAST